MTTPSKMYKIADKLQKLNSEYSRLSWTKYTTGLDFGVNAAYGCIVKLLKDQSNWDIINEVLLMDNDEMLTRKAFILWKIFRPFHLSPQLTKLAVRIQKLTTELSGVLNTHRCKVRGSEMTSPEIARLLSSEPDRDLRKDAFLSRTQVASPLVDAGFLELLSMRAEYARLMGEKNYVDYSLKDQELDADLFKSWPVEFNKIKKLTTEVRSEFAERFVRTAEPMPWDEAFIASSIAPELDAFVDMSDFHKPVANLFNPFGFNISEMNITYDVFPRKHKSEWGYNFTLETGIDSRILANVRNRYADFRVLLHETGHAVHSFASNPSEIILNMGISGIISEGIANLFGSFRSRESFFSGFFPESAKVKENFNALERWSRASRLHSLGSILFDAALYTSSPSSLEEIEQLRWDTDEKLFGRAKYSHRPVWANTIHHTTHPIYLHNYLLGDLTCDMLESVFLKREKVRCIMEKPHAFGAFLREKVIAPSGRYPFPELFRKISGEELSLRFLVDRIKEKIQ